MKYKVLGAGLDVLDIESKILLKKAYAKAVQDTIIKNDFIDVYDVFKSLLNGKFGNLQFAGKIKIPSHLTSKPKFKDLKFLTSQTFSDFFHNDRFFYYSEKVRNFVKKISPSYPVMIGVDHSLSGGVLKALKERFKDFGVVIFDAHFDAVSYRARKNIAEYLQRNSSLDFQSSELNTDYENYNCANFLKYLIRDNIIAPENIVIVGVSDYPDERLKLIDDINVSNYIKEYLHYERKGVKILPKNLIRNKFSLFEETVNKLKTKYLYISFDIDVALSKTVIAARFFDTFGLTFQEIDYLTKVLGNYLRDGKLRLIGFDFCEIDIHLLNLGADKTLNLCMTVIENIL